MPDVREGSLHLPLLVWRIFTEAHQAPSRLVNLVAPNRIPRGFRGEVSANEEGDGPDPLEDEREPPTEIAFDACYGPDDTRGEENTAAPAHADVGGEVGSEDSGDDLGSIGRGEGLAGIATLDMDRLPYQVKFEAYLENAP